MTEEHVWTNSDNTSFKINRSTDRRVLYIDIQNLSNEDALKFIDERKNTLIQNCAETRNKND